jgi:hypothetical protein
MTSRLTPRSATTSPSPAPYYFVTSRQETTISSADSMASCDIDKPRPALKALGGAKELYVPDGSERRSGRRSPPEIATFQRPLEVRCYLPSIRMQAFRLVFEHLTGGGIDPDFLRP